MAVISINRVTNANVYLNGNSILGQCEECDLPDIKSIFTEHKAIGMIGKSEFFSGVDKLEAKFKWNSFYPDTLLQTANPVKTSDLQIRSSLESYDSTGRSSEVPVVIHMTGQFKDFSPGKYKQHDNVDTAQAFATQYLKMEINGALIVEYDALANIYIVGGEDILKQYRTNLGI